MEVNDATTSRGNSGCERVVGGGAVVTVVTVADAGAAAVGAAAATVVADLAFMASGGVTSATAAAADAGAVAVFFAFVIMQTRKSVGFKLHSSSFCSSRKTFPECINFMFSAVSSAFAAS